MKNSLPGVPDLLLSGEVGEDVLTQQGKLWPYNQAKSLFLIGINERMQVCLLQIFCS